MDHETHALVRHLFAEISVCLETAQGIAVDGQGIGRRSAKGLELISRLEGAVADAVSLVAATRVLLSRAATSRPASSTHRRRRSRQT